MRAIFKAILAGAALMTGVAALTPAFAQDSQSHVMDVPLPDGSVARIQYSGNVPPRVAVEPGSMAFVAPSPVFDQSFAALEQVSAMMQRQAAVMMHQIAEMQAAMAAPMATMPAGARIYAMSSTLGGNGACMRSVQVTYDSSGKPNVISRVSGDCNPSHGSAVPMEMRAPAPAAHSPGPSAGRLIEAQAGSHQPGTAQDPLVAMAEPVSFQH
ncbi:hypothetical protein [Rhodopila sp.]|jgi:hypothetical protein|uniref:hypothetical protein n=1 Tax=Rhodopila sp. TaxID=2480087 RepID=UPI002BE6D7D3|nr:hypothetical protein [Rhodopila sp.]HVZ08286.1 hypothetical protein [Rhodopila sp.]